MEKNITVVLPCLNEEKTISYCVEQALIGISNSKFEGQVLVADNGSTDNSVSLAKQAGAKVVSIKKKGYGAALNGGIKASRSKYIIMGDSDSTYNFLDIPLFIKKLEEGYDLVVGNRFKGGIEKKAMPFLNKYLGNPLLSFIAKKLFNSNIGDFHCGLRGFTNEAYKKMDLKSDGMEFATEMIAKSSLLNLKISEVPTTLSVSISQRKPHLRPLRDGFRHLKLMLTYSFLKVSNLSINLGLFVIGTAYVLAVAFTPYSVGEVTFSFGFLKSLENLVLIFLIFKSMFKLTKDLFPDFMSIKHKTDKNNGVWWFIFGLILYVADFLYWKQFNFGEIDENINLKLISVASISIVYGIFELFRSVVTTTINYFKIDD